jgi:predicted alpha/beta superfamily hydrolase
MTAKFFLLSVLFGFVVSAVAQSPVALSSTDKSILVDYSKLQGLGTVEYLLLTEEKSSNEIQNYHIFVRLPDGYSKDSSITYPTVYLLDGGTNFPMMAAYYRYLRFTEELPDLIIVGISYGTDDWKEGNARSFDYTAPADQAEHWGGASQFDQFIARKLMPTIQSKYKVDGEQQILFGQSLGGQFALYTSMYGVTPFYAVIASNPAFHRNLAFFKQTLKPSKKRPMAFVSLAELDDERFRIPAKDWQTFWRKKNPPDWQLQFLELQGHNHLSANPEVFRQGLKWVLSTQQG